MSQNPDVVRADGECPVALVTGGSSGLGKAIAAALLNRNYRVVIVGRDAQRLAGAAAELCAATKSPSNRLVTRVCDVTRFDAVDEMRKSLETWPGRLDVLVNCVGQSDRGFAKDLKRAKVVELIDSNLIAAIHCSNAFLPLLEQCRGSIVNIGSLASKFGSRYLGGYPMAKHALAGWTQQFRLECQAVGVHAGLVCPGPICREDANQRYDDLVEGDLPSQAGKPGGGARVKGLSHDQVADAVVRCVKKRLPEIILPRKARLLLVLQSLSPRLGDWMLVKFTSDDRG